MHGAGALRVMGIPFGVTDSAARVLWWNQAMDIPAIEWLVANEEAVRASATSTLGNIDNADQSITVDAVFSKCYVRRNCGMKMPC